VKRSKTAVIGLGNRLLSDEGAGLHAVELLRTKLHDEDLDLDLVEAGTPGMNLLHQFDEREKIIFIDAGNCGAEPGHYRRFRPDEVTSRKELKDFSLHEFDLIDFLEFARSLHPERKVDVVIYCVQVVSMEMSEQLSPKVEKNLTALVQDVYNEIKEGENYA